MSRDRVNVEPQESTYLGSDLLGGLELHGVCFVGF